MIAPANASVRCVRGRRCPNASAIIKTVANVTCRDLPSAAHVVPLKVESLIQATVDLFHSRTLAVTALPIAAVAWQRREDSSIVLFQADTNRASKLMRSAANDAHAFLASFAVMVVSHCRTAAINLTVLIVNDVVVTPVIK